MSGPGGRRARRAVAPDDPLGALARACHARETAETAELEAVRVARAAGVSWTAIGVVYGLTKQGAQQRFKPLLDGDALRSIPRSTATPEP